MKSANASPARRMGTAADIGKQIAATLRFGYGLQLNAPPIRLAGSPDVERYACKTIAGPFVLRRFHAAQSLDAVRRSLEIVDSLVHSGFPTAAPLYTHDDHTLVMLGESYAALFYTVEGVPPRASAPVLRAIGRTIGQFHLLCSYEDSSTLQQLPLRSALETRLSVLSQRGGLSAAAAEVATAIGERLGYLQLGTMLPTGILHGGLTTDQLVCASDGTVYIHDSDVFARGPLLLDLAMIASECCFQPPEQPALQLALLGELIEGYSLGARRKIGMEEWRALPMMIYYGTLLLSASQLAGRARDLAAPPDLPAWRMALAIESIWERFSASVVELGLNQLAPPGSDL